MKHSFDECKANSSSVDRHLLLERVFFMEWNTMAYVTAFTRKFNHGNDEFQWCCTSVRRWSLGFLLLSSTCLSLAHNRANSLYSGKINLHQHHVDIEAIHTHLNSGQIKTVVYQEIVFESERNFIDLIERLTIYRRSRNVQLLQLIDLNFLSSESAYDEKENKMDVCMIIILRHWMNGDNEQRLNNHWKKK